MSDYTDISQALSSVEPGTWVVGVSGGADSIALLYALRETRTDLSPVVAHVDHETRAGASAQDAAFVAELCARLNVPCELATLTTLGVQTTQANVEAHFRAARHRHFRNVVDRHRALGVLLAHHADDRAETVLLRVLRHAEPWTIDGLRGETTIEALRVVRPFLALRRQQLSDYLHALGQTWREDQSNTSETFARNRVRAFLKARPDLVGPLLAMADAAEAYRTLLKAPLLPTSFACEALADLPDPVARRAARRWLMGHGATIEDCSAGVCERLIRMTRDASTPARTDFPGGLSVRRRSGQVFVED